APALEEDAGDFQGGRLVLNYQNSFRARMPAEAGALGGNGLEFDEEGAAGVGAELAAGAFNQDAAGGQGGEVELERGVGEAQAVGQDAQGPPARGVGVHGGEDAVPRAGEQRFESLRPVAHAVIRRRPCVPAGARNSDLITFGPPVTSWG